MDIDEPLELPVLSTQHVSRPVDVDRTVLCSPHDLVAIVTHSHDVAVYRLNGQVAFTVKNPEANPYDDDDSDLPKATCLAWSPSGRSLAIAWSDGSWNIHEAEKGEIIFKDTVASSTAEDDKPVHVVNFDWREHKTPSTTARAPTEKHHGSSISDAAPPDLPRAITLHDVTKILPKLSALPSHGLRSGVDGAKFANQAATDAMFGSLDSEINGSDVEILTVHASDGAIRIMLGGTSHVGTIQGRPKTAPLHAVTMPDQSTLGFFSQEAGLDIQLEQLKIPLAELNSPLLHGLAHNTSQLSALSLYLQRSVHCIVHDYTTGVGYPERLIKNLAMTMDERDDSSATVSSALVHLAMTGQFHPDVLEWLVDIVKETSLKRWDTSITGMYSAIQTHLHLHMLPALDRVSIAASRIRGFARLHQGSTRFAPDEALFSDILAQTDVLRSRVRAMLHVCISEWSLWRAFYKWLKMQIDIGTATPGTKSAAEAEERECSAVDIRKVLEYVQSVLGSGSALKSAIQPTSTATAPQSSNNGGSSADRIEALQPLMLGVQDSIETALHAITDWQGRLFTKPSFLKLGITDRGRLSSAARIELPDAEHRKADLIAVAMLDPDASDKLEVLCIEQTVPPSSPTGLPSFSTYTLADEPILEVIDAGFLHHRRQLIVLRRSSAGEHDAYELGVHKLLGSTFDVAHRFDPAVQFKPTRMFVGGRHDKEFCVVFDATGTRWQVLDLRTTSR